MIVTFIFGMGIGGALVATIIWFIAEYKYEKYLNRLERTGKKPW